MQFHQGLRLKKIIEEKNLVTAKIAAKLGFERRQNLSYYYTVENIKPDVLEKILGAMGVDMDYFLKGNKSTVEKERDEWKNKYYELLEKYTALIENTNILNKKFKLRQNT